MMAKICYNGLSKKKYDTTSTVEIINKQTHFTEIPGNNQQVNALTEIPQNNK